MSTYANDTGVLGASLKERRTARNLSQEALARLSDCSTGYVRLLERGFQPARSDVLPRVLAALDQMEPAA